MISLAVKGLSEIKLGQQNTSYLSIVFSNLVINTSVNYKQSFLLFVEMYNINAHLKNAFLLKLCDLKE